MKNISHTKLVLIAYLFMSSTACSGGTNDAPAINAKISATAGEGGGFVVLPPGIYMIDAVNTPIRMQSNVFLVLSPGAVLQAITNSAANYAVVQAIGVSNSGIYGGAIVGDRATHTGTTGEWGFGIDLESVTNFTISGVNISNCWGDGIYVSDNNNPQTPSRGVWISGIVSDNNRRQGLSGIAWVGGSISGSTFSNTNGTAPSAGIDLEPNLSTEQVSGISISENEFLNNAGSGINLLAYTAGNMIFNNTFSGNRRGLWVEGSSNNTIMNNTIVDNQAGGVNVLPSSSYNTVNFNVFSNNNTASLQSDGVYINSNKNIVLKNSFNSQNDYMGLNIAPNAISNYSLGNAFSGSFTSLPFVNAGSGTVVVNGF